MRLGDLAVVHFVEMLRSNKYELDAQASGSVCRHAARHGDPLACASSSYVLLRLVLFGAINP